MGPDNCITSPPTRSAALLLACSLACSTLAQGQLDSLLRVLPGIHGKERITALGDIGWELGMTDAKAALPYGEEALALAVSLADSASVAQAANDLAITEYRIGRIQRAIQLNQRALAIRKQLQDTLAIAASHSKLALCYTDRMRFDSALIHNYAAAAIYDHRGDVQRFAQVRGNIGLLYQQMDDLEKAEDVIRGTVDQLRDSGVSYPLATIMGQFCQVLEKRGKTDEAYQVGLEALAMFEQLGMRPEIASLNNELGMIARRKGEDATGLAYYRKALYMAEGSDDLAGMATYGMNVANVLLETGQVKASIPYYLNSLAICRNQGFANQHMSVLGGYIKALESTGDLRGALAGQAELLALKDSVYKADRLAVIGDMQVKYDTERTEQELALSREKEEAQRAELERKRLLQGALLAGIVLLAAIALLFISRQRARHRARLNASLLAEREKGLKAMIASTDAERKRIAVELHDGIGQQLTGLKYRLEDLSERVVRAAPTEEANLTDVRSIADEVGREVRGIAHRMMPRSLGKLGLVPAMEDMLRKSLELPRMKHSFEHFGLDGRLPSEVEVGVFRIAQELVGNVLKHADATEVDVQLLRTKGNLVLLVEDNGKGLDRQPTGMGMGLQSMTDRARAMQGTIRLEKGPKGGTLATLRVPLSTE